MSDIQFLNGTFPERAGAPAIFSDHRRRGFRLSALLAALVLLAAAPLAPPAHAGEQGVQVGSILDSPELFEVFNAGANPGTPVTYEVFAADGDASMVLKWATSSETFNPVSFDLTDGDYKIRATAPGFVDSWYSASSGETGDSVREMFGYQSRRDFGSADVIRVDSSVAGGSTWGSAGWTVLHRSASSISGAVATEATGQSGSLLAGVRVELHAAALPGSAPVAATTTDANGYYTFENASAGDYKVRFSTGSAEKWWPETNHSAEAEVISLDGANYFNLAYATFPAVPVPVDPQRSLELSGSPATGATLTAVPDRVETGGLFLDCLQRYTWYLDGNPVPDAFGPRFVVPLSAAGKTVTVRLDNAGLGCAATALLSGPVGPIDPRLTVTGPGMKVAPPDESGNVSATLAFDSVTSPGTTSLTLLDIGDAQTPAPAGFSLLTDPPLIYEITTTAGFEGSVEVCFNVGAAGATGAERLYHYVNGGWEDITRSYAGGVLCGATDSFSPFAVGQPWWPFQGFQRPVDNGSALNAMKAGAAVPIKFSVGGARGLNILAEGSPSSSKISCSGSAAPDTIEQAVSAGGSTLGYHAGSATYTYVWKTQKLWAGTCRQFVVTLADGTSHSALFDFRK